jgi:hypothetical protein
MANLGKIFKNQALSAHQGKLTAGSKEAPFPVGSTGSLPGLVAGK